MPYRPPVHQPALGSAAQRRMQLDRWRGSAASRGYDAAWRLLRKAKLAADPLCWWCLREGILTPAKMPRPEGYILPEPPGRMISDEVMEQVWREERDGR